MNRGGSNYPFYDVGVHSQPPDKTWVDDGNLKLVVGNYHLDFQKINLQLQTMFDGGQRKLALIIWFKPILQTTTFYPDIDRHMLNSDGGSLSIRHEANLYNLVKKIRETGFTSLVVRFAPQGVSHPGEWLVWDENRYQENLSFILLTRNVVENVRLFLPATYDLSVELGGSNTKQALEYQARLWSDYTSRFHFYDSYAFSFACGDRAQILGDRITRMMDNFKAKSLPVPQKFALDIYNDEIENLKVAAGVLGRKKEIIIQESWYNDAASYKNILTADRQFKMNISEIFQWPRRREDTRHVFVNAPLEYNNYY